MPPAFRADYKTRRTLCHELCHRLSGTGVLSRALKRRRILGSGLRKPPEFQLPCRRSRVRVPSSALKSPVNRGFSFLRFGPAAMYVPMCPENRPHWAAGCSRGWNGAIWPRLPSDGAGRRLATAVRYRTLTRSGIRAGPRCRLHAGATLCVTLALRSLRGRKGARGAHQPHVDNPAHSVRRSPPPNRGGRIDATDVSC